MTKCDLYSGPFVENRLHMPVKGDDFGLDSDLFHEFPGERGGERLADLDPAARQAEMAKQRRSRPADDERPAVPKHRRRDREDWAGGKQPVVHVLSRVACSSKHGRIVLSESRLVDWERGEKTLLSVSRPSSSSHPPGANAVRRQTRKNRFFDIFFTKYRNGAMILPVATKSPRALLLAARMGEGARICGN